MAKKPKGAAGAEAIVDGAEEAVDDAETAFAKVKRLRKELSAAADEDKAALAAELETAENEADIALADAVTFVKETREWLTKNKAGLEKAAETTPSLATQLQSFNEMLTGLGDRLKKLEEAKPLTPEPPPPNLAPNPPPTPPAPGGAGDRQEAKPKPAATEKEKRYRAI